MGLNTLSKILGLLVCMERRSKPSVLLNSIFDHKTNYVQTIQVWLKGCCIARNSLLPFKYSTHLFLDSMFPNRRKKIRQILRHPFTPIIPIDMRDSESGSIS